MHGTVIHWTAPGYRIAECGAGIVPAYRCSTDTAQVTCGSCRRVIAAAQVTVPELIVPPPPPVRPRVITRGLDQIAADVVDQWSA